MFRLFIALTAIATVMTVTAAAPGRKRDERTEWYFPTKVGDKQVYTVTYRSEDGAVVMEQVRTRTVSAVKLASGEAVVTTRDEADVGPTPRPTCTACPARACSCYPGGRQCTTRRSVNSNIPRKPEHLGRSSFRDLEICPLP
jgi:uncharacterized protein (DUF58 family)